MVEVFRTNVEDPDDAKLLVNAIQRMNINFIANFDLDDCDRILRVKSTSGAVPAEPIIALVNSFGFQAEVLPDEYTHPQMSSEIELQTAKPHQ